MDNSSFNSWSYMRTRVITGEGDSILCVNTTLPKEVLGTIRAVGSTAEIGPDSYDLILGQKLLNDQYHIGDHFNTIKGHINENGIYALAEPITGSADAWLNALMFAVSPRHVRTPRAEEVIGIASDYFDIIEFLRFDSMLSYEIPADTAENIRTQIDAMPPEIFSRLAPTIEGSTLSLTMLTGLFVWQKSL